MFYILIILLIIGIVEWRNGYININVKVDPEKVFFWRDIYTERLQAEGVQVIGNTTFSII